MTTFLITETKQNDNDGRETEQEDRQSILSFISTPGVLFYCKCHIIFK